MTGVLGQACFFFSQGCSIGCERCDNATVGPSYTKTKWSMCNNTKVTASICDANLRTVNTDAACGSDQDRWYYTPWRSPGLAPVADACGMAGGALAASHRYSG